MSRARGQIRLFFGIGLIKIYLIGSLVPVFKKKQINSLSLHPTVLLNNTTIHFIFILRKIIYIFCYFKNGSNILEEKNVGDENGLQRIHVWTH